MSDDFGRPCSLVAEARAPAGFALAATLAVARVHLAAYDDAGASDGP